MKNSKHYIMVPVRLGPPAHPSKLFGEWQQRGPESLSGQIARKLRLTLASPQAVATASAGG